MTNPTSYTDEQVLARAKIVWDADRGKTSEMLRSLLAARQRMQADCITYWNHVAELQAKVAGLQAEVEALREAVGEVIAATRDYLPPDGISKDEYISRVIGATDNASIFEVMK